MTRLAGLETLRVDPAEVLSFRFQGREMTGLEGDTVATALYASGVRIFSRSLEYHRPRGLYGLDGVGAGTMMTIDGVPNCMAETIPLSEGLRVEAQNYKGSLDRDLLGVLDRMSWAMPAGFYYRVMHRPAVVWPLAAESIRKLAGLGVVDPRRELSGRFDEVYPTVDIGVVGGGVAGMQAALAAAGRGLRVALLERRAWLGGEDDHRRRSDPSGRPATRRAREMAVEVDSTEGIRVFRRAALVGVYNDGLLTAFQVGTAADPFVERYVEIRARAVVTATGCIERPALFEHNERPGVMQVGCAHRLAHTYGVLAGRRAVVSVGQDAGLECAVDLADRGLEVVCVADARSDGHDAELVGALETRGIPLLRGWTTTAARGRRRVTGATLRSLDGSGERAERCDLLIASAGLSPLTGPVTMAGGSLGYDRHTGFFLPGSMPAWMEVAGRVTGLTDPAAIELSGRAAGLRAAARCGAEVEPMLSETVEEHCSRPGPTAGSSLVAVPGAGRKAFVCFDEDTTVQNVRQAIDQGFDLPELIKRFAAVGTGPGQGGIPGHNLPLVVAEIRGQGPDEVRPTMMRAPMVPVSMGALAGPNHDMCKRTPLHDSQRRPGAVMRRIGAWRRVRYFSDDLSCRREIHNVRTNVGMLDGSTLGKFRLWGPNALDALQRVYVSDLSKLTPGRVKYSAMCTDDGCLVDDGVIVERGEDEYYFTTSSGRAGQTIEWIRFHTRFDGWDFQLANLTDAMGVVNLSGPNARRVLERVTDADVSNEGFPFAGYRELRLAGEIPARVMRLGFVGELSFELHVPASSAQSAWDLIAAAGEGLGIAPFGVEAQNVMRMEKGHLIVGSESEQRTTLLDLGLGFLWATGKPEAKTVGAVALRQTADQADRLTLVGFEMDDPARTPRDGSIVVDTRIRGWVCISRYSHALERSIGMALVDAQLAAVGTRLEIYEDGCRGALASARVVKMPFYDPDGRRMRM